MTATEKRSDAIKQLRDLISASHAIAIFTGAGISTESGIPDFRSPGGVWDKYQPIYFEDFLRSEEMRRESWRRKLHSDRVITKAKPNAGHLAVAELVKYGKVSAVITQNIDNLHQDSGVPEDQVIELHGNSTYARCLDCDKRYELDPIFAAFAEDETLPVCEDCHGIVKTATISFGQAMPEMAMLRAQAATEACDLFLVLGSSLSVYPAAGFPEYAAQLGTALVIINRDPTGLDQLARLVINDEIGNTMQLAIAP